MLTWTQCGACNRWRQIPQRRLKEVEEVEWDCTMLFQGATCALEDDWEMALQGRSSRKRNRSAEAAARENAERRAREEVRGLKRDTCL